MINDPLLRQVSFLKMFMENLEKWGGVVYLQVNLLPQDYEALPFSSYRIVCTFDG